MNKISFEKANTNTEEIIFRWLAEPHMQEFWDNTQEHKDDIRNFIYGRKQHYFYGTTQYWVGYFDNEPFCFILSDQILPSQTDLSVLHKKNLSRSGNTISIDFGIGNTKFLGRGLAAQTLERFVEFYHTNIDRKADTFTIDPNVNNPRAFHVYEKAGFKMAGYYKAIGGAFGDEQMCLMVKKLVSETKQE